MIQQAVRFGIVGVANTAAGYAVVLTALAIGFGDYAANALGYAIGLLLGFALNKHWAFSITAGRDRLSGRRQITLYLVAFALSYGLNFGILAVLRSGNAVSSPFAQLAAMTAYTLCFFLLCQYFVFSGDGNRHLGLLTSPGPVLAAVAIVGAPFVTHMQLSHDVIWQLWIARQMNHGSKLYIDIIEINPPLWFWMGLTVEKIGPILNSRPSSLLCLAIWFWAAFSAYAVSRLTPEVSRQRRTVLALFTFAVYILMPLHNYGQREQLVLIGTIPYAFLLAARVKNAALDNRLVWLLCFGAAFGFALKHYFALVPIFGEVWLVLRMGKNYRVFRSEIVILLFSALTYGLSIFILAKPFLTQIFPMVELAYGGFSAPLISQISQLEIIFWLISSLIFIKFRRTVDISIKPFFEIMSVFFLVFVFSYFLQQKGWQYHAIPATGTSMMAVFVGMILPASIEAHFGWTLLSAISCSLPLILGVVQGPYSNDNKRFFDGAVQGTAPGSNFLAIITHPSWIWPAVEEEGYKWPSRYFAFWMIPAIRENEVSPGADRRLRWLGEQVVRNTAEDMRCNPPQRLFIEENPIRPNSKPVPFQMLGFFMRDPQFAKIMRNYRIITDKPAYKVFDLQRPYGPQKGDRCRTIY